MSKQLYHEEIFGGRDYSGRFPMEKLKRVDQPTTKITDSIPRFDEREHGFARAMRGDFGPALAREMARFVDKYPLGAAFATMTAHLAPVVDGEIAPLKAPIPEDPQILSRHIKRLGYFLRADIMGICQLPQYAVYSHGMDGNPVELNHQFAIVILIDQDYETMCGSTGDDWISGSQSFIGYSTTAFISCIMADYIRKLGYPARAHHAFNYQVLVVPLLLLAGIGEMCRAGIVLNPFLGTRFKAAVVTTDLPLEEDKPVDFGLQEFCRKCLKCAVECHANAIPDGDKGTLRGYENWRFDAERCSKYRIANSHGSSCGRCIKVCPWNKPEGWTHYVVRWLVKYAPFLDRFLVKMDDIWGYGRQDKRYKWWFDLEEVEGVIKTPAKSS
ncbi:MAG: reductive dehalogenase [Dehalococcoidia bacterium]|nr:reductive dehalogenase [Dehalococcoidia bacterium]